MSRFVELRDLAERQFGYFSSRQLLSLGLEKLDLRDCPYAVVKTPLSGVYLSPAARATARSDGFVDLVLMASLHFSDKGEIAYFCGHTALALYGLVAGDASRLDVLVPLDRSAPSVEKQGEIKLHRDRRRIDSIAISSVKLGSIEVACTSVLESFRWLCKQKNADSSLVEVISLAYRKKLLTAGEVVKLVNGFSGVSSDQESIRGSIVA